MRQAPLLCWHLSQQWGNSRKKRAAALAGPSVCRLQHNCWSQVDASPPKLSGAEAVGPALPVESEMLPEEKEAPPAETEVQLPVARAVLPEEIEA